MDLEPQVPLNVLNYAAKNQKDPISQVAAMINNSGMNRGQRRRLEKALAKTERLTERAQKRLDRSAYREYKAAVNRNFMHFFATLALTMGEDYHWREDEQHDQISSLLERVEKKLEKLSAQGYDTEDIVKMVDEKYNLCLVSKEEEDDNI